MVSSSPQNSASPTATLCLALAGRTWAWPLTARFLERQTYPHQSIRLLIQDTSGDATFRGLVEQWLSQCDYGEKQLETPRLGASGLADQDRPAHTEEVRQVCAKIYARFASQIFTPLVFTLEDDVLPEPEVYRKLSALLTTGIGSASAFYLGRLAADPIAWIWSPDRRPVPAEPAAGATEVGGHGFGAAAFRGEIFVAERFHARLPHGDFDYNFFHRLVLEEGWKTVVDWDCPARHYSAPDQWVQTPPTALRLRLLRGGETPLAIVHLNPYDRHGGAERLAEGLIHQQLATGHRSLAIVGRKNFVDSPALAFDLDPDLGKREELHRAGWPDYEFRGSHRLPEHPAVRAASVIHAHNLSQGWFHPFSLISLSQSRPVVWSIHDMQALTGYCSHALDCPRWQTGCGACPDLTKPGAPLPFDNTAALWRDKKLISANSRLWMVGASHWMVGNLRRSLLGNQPIHHIPNGIDTTTFHPTDRREMRARFGLPADALIIGSLARSGILSHPWKGGVHALIALETLQRDYPQLIFLDIGSTRASAQTWIRPAAPATDEELRDLLGTLDFFLYPSIADTAPLAVLEALACGLPVLGFATGGIPDMVTPEEGILLPTGDTTGLLNAARVLAADADFRKCLGSSARERAVRLFDVRTMAAAYERLYHEAIVAHAGDNLPRHTVVVEKTGGLEELRQSQGKVVALKVKLQNLRDKLQRQEAQLVNLAHHPWVRAGQKFRLFRDPLKKFLRQKKLPKP